MKKQNNLNRGERIVRICKCCGERFTARVADIKRGWGKFCSKSCKAKEQESRTGQYSAFKQRQSRDLSNDSDFQVFEEGWDSHKNG